MRSHKILASVVLLLALASTPSFAQEAKWIAVLHSNASLEEKSTACRELARVGTKESVPALAALLGDEKLSHMARYALETIHDPSVDDALRAALAKVPSRQRLGVIGSLGVRHDAKAVEPLTAFLKGPDADAAQAAARALGMIGTIAAANALEGALDGASGARLAAICEGLLRAAESQRAEGHALHAAVIYDQLRGMADAPSPVRAAALRGAILTSGKHGAPLVVEAIRGSDKTLAAAACARRWNSPQPRSLTRLAAELPKKLARRSAAACSSRCSPTAAIRACCPPYLRQQRATTASFVWSHSRHSSVWAMNRALRHSWMPPWIATTKSLAPRGKRSRHCPARPSISRSRRAACPGEPKKERRGSRRLIELVGATSQFCGGAGALAGGRR